MIDISPCPICKNKDVNIKECWFNGRHIAYNVYCPKCNWTGRSYKMRVKAINKWNTLAKQVEDII